MIIQSFLTPSYGILCDPEITDNTRDYVVKKFSQHSTVVSRRLFSLVIWITRSGWMDLYSKNCYYNKVLPFSCVTYRGTKGISQLKARSYHTQPSLVIIQSITTPWYGILCDQEITDNIRFSATDLCEVFSRYLSNEIRFNGNIHQTLFEPQVVYQTHGSSNAAQRDLLSKGYAYIHDILACKGRNSHPVNFSYNPIYIKCLIWDLMWSRNYR